jgi:poly-beta-1,6-N-acetyl-D-glucosamine N-deacetylase
VRRRIAILGMIALAAVLGLSGYPAHAMSQQKFIALCYHNLEDTNPDQRFVGVSTSNFVAQLSWFQREGYRFLSIDDLIAARDGRKPLPAKSVLLAFDDGYESFYTRAFPILKAFHAHAILGLVGTWMLAKPGGTALYSRDTVMYGGHPVPRDWFMTWKQVREVEASGLVEIASHSYDLHHGILANPQGNLEPAAVTRLYNPKTGYQSEAAYRRRIGDDTARMVQTIQRETGHRPRVMIWPYGEYSRLAVSIQAAHGIPITFTLRDGSASIVDLSAEPRDLISLDPSLADFVTGIREIDEVSPVRAVQVDLDYVYDPNPAQQDRNLGVLVQQIHDLDISTVYLQAFADPDGTGVVRQVYFPNNELPMRADLFNRAAWQLRTRAHVKVYAWLPVLTFDFGSGTLQHVTAWRDPQSRKAPTAGVGNIPRLSPFDPKARRRIIRLYADLAEHAPIAGILFGDDAVLSDYEDASRAALDAYARAGLPRSIAAIRANPELFKRWTNLKTDTLIKFTQKITQAVRRYRTPVQTARNIFARPLLNPASAAWFAQQYDNFLTTYDYTVVMAMPQLENVPEADTSSWLTRLVAVAKARPDGLRKTVFELQSVDWRNQSLGASRDIPSETLAGEMDLLERLGALNLAYYPDDFLHDQPRAAVIHPAFSLQSHPYRSR